MAKAAITAVPQASFADLGLKERADVQRLLRECIDVISPETLIISEEFGDWADCNRRIDLLGVDKGGALVVIELKRTEDGGHMELQALRYAAMISTMTFEQAVEAYRRYIQARNLSIHDPAAAILEFTGRDDSSDFNSSVRIVLASADFSKEITSSVLWLNDQGLDIRCVRLRPHRYGDRVLLDVQQVIPLPEAADFQVAIQQKSQEKRAAERGAGRDFTKYDLTISGQSFTSLNKRRFVLEVVREAIRQEMSPKRIAEVVPESASWMFISLPGSLNHDEFIEAADGMRVARYFTRDDELFHVGGETYALTNQWGRRTEPTVKAILDHIPDRAGISYSPVGD